MSLKSTASKFRQVRCGGAAEGIESLLNQPGQISVETQEILEFVADCELHKREETRVEKAIKKAGIPFPHAEEEDLLLTLGAGDIGAISRRLYEDCATTVH